MGEGAHNFIMNWEAHWSICYTKNLNNLQRRKEARSKNISMGRKTFSIRAACLICKFSICKFNKNTNSCCIISYHNIQPLISKDTLERKKKNPKNQPLRCHHTEQHSCSFFWLFPAIRAIKINNINRQIYPQHSSTQIEHSEKAILNNVIT